MPNRKKTKSGASNDMQKLLSLLTKASVSGPPAVTKKRRKRKKATSAVSQMDGVIRLSRSELLRSVTISKGNTSSSDHVDILPSEFPFLKGIATSFDRLRWEKLEFFYKPAVGTVFGGLVTVGFDWDFNSSDLDRTKISALTPTFTVPAWADSESKPMRLPPNRLQSRDWYTPNYANATYNDRGPGKIHIATTVTAQTADTILGEVWCRYSVVMQGTNAQ